MRRWLLVRRLSTKGRRGEPLLWHQRTEETLKAIRDEAVQVEAARTAGGYGIRLAEEDGTLAGKVRTFILDQVADSVDHGTVLCVFRAANQ